MCIRDRDTDCIRVNSLRLDVSTKDAAVMKRPINAKATISSTNVIPDFSFHTLDHRCLHMPSASLRHDFIFLVSGLLSRLYCILYLIQSDL